jgi:formylglycine-generating enzyme required for sulfatase activity
MCGILGLKFRLISAGRLLLGSPENDEWAWPGEKPQREVAVQDFWLAVTPVTVAMWKMIMGGWRTPSEFTFYREFTFHRMGIDGEELPIHQITSFEIAEFIHRLNMMEQGVSYRLPTDVEWEYAARAGTTTRYFWGDEIDGDYLWYIDNSQERPHPVGTKKPNPWGLYDMLGGMWELTSDLLPEGYYDEDPADNPRGELFGPKYVFRGGCWKSRPRLCRCANRNWIGFTEIGNGVGFRLARCIESSTSRTAPARVGAVSEVEHFWITRRPED